MTAALDAIRDRDAEASVCKRCGHDPKSLGHTETLEECDARLHRLSDGQRGCWDPDEHHTYQPGGINEYSGDAATDRRVLLAALDRAEAVVAAARVAHDAWFGGLIDSDYDRMASIFDDLRAALRAYEDADKVADDA